MNDMEARLAALELLEIERMALDPPPLVTKLRDIIVLGFVGPISDDERMIREQALRLIEDAQRRHLTFTGGTPSDND